MAVTFVGPLARMTFAGLTFNQGVPRPVPPGVAESLAGHPWFVCDEVAPPEPRRRKRKANDAP